MKIMEEQEVVRLLTEMKEEVDALRKRVKRQGIKISSLKEILRGKDTVPLPLGYVAQYHVDTRRWELFNQGSCGEFQTLEEVVAHINNEG